MSVCAHCFRGIAPSAVAQSADVPVAMESDICACPSSIVVHGSCLVEYAKQKDDCPRCGVPLFPVASRVRGTSRSVMLAFAAVHMRRQTETDSSAELLNEKRNTADREFLSWMVYYCCVPMVLLGIVLILWDVDFMTQAHPGVDYDHKGVWTSLGRRISQVVDLVGGIEDKL